MVRANHIVWVAWQQHVRNETLSERIHADLHQLRSSLPRLLRYLVLGTRTVVLFIRNRRARAVIAQNPSIVLAYLAVILGRLFDMQVALDAHNAALDPPGGAFMRWAARKVIALAPLTIVTNEPLAGRVSRMGGRAVVVPDPIPSWSSDASVVPGRVTVISGWGDDEPIAEIVDAAGRLPDLELAITGTPDDRIAEVSIPANLTLTGRVPETEYIDLLASSQVVVDLTTRHDCLVCGASEALAVGRPIVLSDTEVLQERFGPAATFTRPVGEDIAAAVRRALDADARAVETHRVHLDEKWDDYRDDLMHDLARARRRRVRAWNLRREGS